MGPKSTVPTLAAARLQRWALILSSYQYEIKYRGTDAHANADALSWLPVDHVAACQGSELYYFNYAINDLPITCRDIARATQGDKVLSTVLQLLRNGWPDQSCLPEELLPFLSSIIGMSCQQSKIVYYGE